MNAVFTFQVTFSDIGIYKECYGSVAFGCTQKDTKRSKEGGDTFRK
jgi:hypothetical protein